MYSVIVTTETVQDVAYIVTKTLRDNVVVRVVYELASSIDKVSQENTYQFMKSLADQKLEALKNL